MNRTFTRILQVIVYVMLPALVFAQKGPDYRILLNSGNFIPDANVKSISKNNQTFRQSLHDGKYYLVLQFRALPTQKEKDAMQAAGITLGEYIPNLAYTAVVNQQVTMRQLRSFSLRSIFRF